MVINDNYVKIITWVDHGFGFMLQLFSAVSYNDGEYLRWKWWGKNCLTRLIRDD